MLYLISVYWPHALLNHINQYKAKWFMSCAKKLDCSPPTLQLSPWIQPLQITTIKESERVFRNCTIFSLFSKHRDKWGGEQKGAGVCCEFRTGRDAEMRDCKHPSRRKAKTLSETAMGVRQFRGIKFSIEQLWAMRLGLIFFFINIKKLMYGGDQTSCSNVDDHMLKYWLI